MSAAACKIIIDESALIIGATINLSTAIRSAATTWPATAGRLTGKLLCLSGSVPIADAVTGKVDADFARRWLSITEPVRRILNSWGWNDGNTEIEAPFPLTNDDRLTFETFESELDALVADVQGLIEEEE